jgi:hypothetical protein
MAVEVIGLWGKFAVDSPLEGRVHCELVSEIRRRFR